MDEDEDNQHPVQVHMPRTPMIPVSKPSVLQPKLEEILILCGISLGGYVGSLLRIGNSYFQIWKIESNFTIMYAQLLGCAIMGFTTQHKNYFWNYSRFHRVLYITITTGLCGSITTFSTWNFESNKVFFLQMDLNGNLSSTYNGGRVFEFLVSLLAGIAVPMASFTFGKHLSRLSPVVNRTSTPTSKEKMLAESTLFMLFITITLLVVIIPVMTSSQHIAYTCLLGACGAYCRFMLSKLNTKYVSIFPIGTFIANVFGTWLLGTWMTMAKLGAVTDIGHLSMLYGLSIGFCGCLSTVSTFVNELYALPTKYSYIYGFTTYIVSQLGLFFIFDLPIYFSVPQSVVSTTSLDYCASYSSLCVKFLDKINCSIIQRNVNSCDGNTLDSFEGICMCGPMSVSNIIGEILIDAQSKSSISNNLIYTWPIHKNYPEPTTIVDLCMSYENVCKSFLRRISCPSNFMSVKSCDGISPFHYHGKCNCDSLTLPSSHVSKMITTFLLRQRYDLLPYYGYPLTESIEFNKTFSNLCNKILDHIQCPNDSRIIQSGDFENWQVKCRCGSFLSESFILREQVSALLEYNKYESIQQNDLCKSYQKACNNVLDLIKCPYSIRSTSVCNSSTPYIDATCSCSNLKLTSYVNEVVVNSYLMNDIIKYMYVPAPNNAYTLAVSSNPFRVLPFYKPSYL